MESEARAKIFWGESAEEVGAYLQSVGIAQAEAQTMINAILLERNEAVRAKGRRKILLGALLIPVPIIAYFLFAQMTIFPIKMFGVAMAIGLFGLWKLVDGLINVLSPQTDKSDLSTGSAGDD
jgi:hypothetical protein